MQYKWILQFPLALQQVMQTYCHKLIHNDSEPEDLSEKNEKACEISQETSLITDVNVLIFQTLLFIIYTRE